MSKVYFQILTYSLLTVLMAGCAVFDTAAKIGKVLADPSTPVGKESEQPSKISLSLIGEDVLNLNFDGDPTPIQVDFYQLKDKTRFLAADYDSMLFDSKNMLGRSYITHEEYFVEPSGTQYIKDIELEKDTRYLGVVAHYSNIDEVIWKNFIKVDSIGENGNFLILLKEHEIKFNKMDE